MSTIEILMDWGDVLAVNKPAGWLTIPGRGNKEDVPVLSHVLGEQLRGQKARASKEPDLFVIHRLDQWTSGVCLFARTSDAHKALSADFESQKIQKTYWAICKGEPQSGLIDAPLFKLPSKKNKSVVSFEKGKASKTIVRTIVSKDGFSVVEAQPLTGRSHQIRVHLAHSGCPIVGDKLYGGVGEAFGSPTEFSLLHAREVRFRRPGNAETTQVHAGPHGLFLQILTEMGVTSKGEIC